MKMLSLHYHQKNSNFLLFHSSYVLVQIFGYIVGQMRKIIKVSIKLASEKLVFNCRSFPCLPPHTASQALDLTEWKGVLQDLQEQSIAFYLVTGENSSKSSMRE